MAHLLSQRKRTYVGNPEDALGFPKKLEKVRWGIEEYYKGRSLSGVEGRINKKNKLPNLDEKQYAENGSEALTDTGRMSTDYLREY